MNVCLTPALAIIHTPARSNQFVWSNFSGWLLVVRPQRCNGSIHPDESMLQPCATLSATEPSVLSSFQLRWAQDQRSAT